MEETYGLKDYGGDATVYSRDPVCGKTVDEEHAAGKTGYAGEMFYFCSADCQIRFEEDPGRYLGQPR